jgi:phosphoribosylanthranilate isomerase
MTVAVKICGLSTPDAIDVAIEAGADMLGFVFFPPSPRHLSYERARILGERVRGRALKVALSVDAADEQFSAMVEALQADFTEPKRRNACAWCTAGLAFPS